MKYYYIINLNIFLEMAGIDEYGMTLAMMMFAMICYSLFSTMIDYYRIKVLHESGMAVLLGILSSVLQFKSFFFKTMINLYITMDLSQIEIILLLAFSISFIFFCRR